MMEIEVTYNSLKVHLKSSELSYNDNMRLITYKVIQFIFKKIQTVTNIAHKKYKIQSNFNTCKSYIKKNIQASYLI